MYGNLSPIVRVLLAVAMSLLIAVSPLVALSRRLFSSARSNVWKFKVGRRPKFLYSARLRISPISRFLHFVLRNLRAAWPWWSAVLALIFGAMVGIYGADLFIVLVVGLGLIYRQIHGGW